MCFLKFTLKNLSKRGMNTLDYKIYFNKTTFQPPNFLSPINSCFHTYIQIYVSTNVKDTYVFISDITNIRRYFRFGAN